MTESVVSGLVVAAVGGLAFLAYRHRRFYVEFRSAVLLLLTLAVIVLFAYEVGRHHGLSAVESFIPSDVRFKAVEALRATPPNVALLMGVCLAVWAYLFFLTLLPTYSDREESRQAVPPTNTEPTTEDDHTSG